MSYKLLEVCPLLRFFILFFSESCSVGEKNQNIIFGLKKDASSSNFYTNHKSMDKFCIKNNLTKVFNNPA